VKNPSSLVGWDAKKNYGDLGMISRIQFLSFQWHIEVFFDPGDILEHVKYNV
jgi:hypothetical protein